MRILILIIIIFQFQSSEVKNINIKIYKDLGIVNRTSEITIQTFWTFKKYDIDSTMITLDEEKKQLYHCLKSIKKEKKKFIPFMNPKFAIVNNFYGEIDTLYIDSEYRFGFWIKRKILIEDKKGVLKSFFKKSNKLFFD